MWLFDFPVKRARAVRVFPGFNERAIGNYRQRLFDRRRQFTGKKIVRVVIARKPVVVIFRFALRPDLARAARIVSGRRDKPQAD